ncbi:hypothetical protein NL676_020103 [Syzygium grande]|nr:hypothetical protein NL676_020103 [Syzygium grande]
MPIMGIVRIRWSFVPLMHRDGVLPSNYTFPFVLKACASDSKPLARGWEVVHGATIKTGLESDMNVEAGLVDAYAKRGQNQLCAQGSGVTDAILHDAARRESFA